jgi:hypothetical protein
LAVFKVGLSGIFELTFWIFLKMNKMLAALFFVLLISFEIDAQMFSGGESNGAMSGGGMMNGGGGMMGGGRRWGNHPRFHRFRQMLQR